MEDSLDPVELVMALEAAFGQEIHELPSDELRALAEKWIRGEDNESGALGSGVRNPHPPSPLRGSATAIPPNPPSSAK